MANEIRDAFNTVYTDGPIGNPSQPAKSRIRQEVGGVIQQQVDGLKSRIDTLVVEADSITVATWTKLSALTGTRVGQRGEVTADNGTHTDPVVGGTVANQGIYSWSSSPAGWQRVGDNTYLANKAEIVRQAKTRAANLVWNGNLDNYGAGVTLFSDLLSSPTNYPSRPNYRISDPTLNRLGCRYGIYVQANTTGLFGNQVRTTVRKFGGYLFCSVIIFNPAGDVWNFGADAGPQATIRYVDGTSAGIALSSYTQIASGIRCYYGTIALTAAKCATVVDIGAFTTTSRGADYVLTGFWTSWSPYSGMTLQDTSWPDWGQTESRRPGLSALKADIADPFVAPQVYLVGDSITWGSNASNMADPDPAGNPHQGKLTDARNNADSPSWANLLRGFIGSMGAAGQNMDVSTINTDGVATYRRGATIDVARDPRVTYWNGTTPLQKAPVVSASAKAGAYLGINQGGNCFLEFTLVGDKFDVFYGTQASGSVVFDIEVDGTVVASKDTYDTSSHFGQSVPVTVAFGMHRVRIINKSTTIAVNIDGVVHNRLIKIVNQGLNGTQTANWAPFGGTGALAGGVDASATHVFIQLGTNDRAAVLGAETTFADRLRAILKWLHGNRPLASVVLMCANKARGAQEVFGDPVKYGYDMAAVSRVINRVAGEFGLDVIDHYGETDAIDAASVAFTATRTSGSTTLTGVSSLAGMVPGAAIRGAGIPGNTTVRYVSGPSTVEISAGALSSGSITDGIVGLYTYDDLHPNDYGYRVMFDTIRRRLLAAPMVGPM